MNYEESYIHEVEKRSYLAQRITELEEDNKMLRSDIERIRNHPLWRLSLPARRAVRFARKLKGRVHGSGKKDDAARKYGDDCGEKIAAAYGTGSFPDETIRESQEQTVFEKMPQISILVPLFNTPELFLRSMIESVLSQTYSHWQLCLADGSDNEHVQSISEIVGEYQQRSKSDDSGTSRIVYERLAKNEGISRNTDRCYQMATGEYIGLLDHDDLLHPEALYWYVKAINEEDADYLYCDEATFEDNVIDKMITLHFKPDYAIDNLRANNYICHFSVFKRSLLEGDELLRAEYDGSQDHEMALRLTDRANRVVHIPKILYYWRAHPASVSSGISAKPYAVDAAKRAIASHLRHHGFEGFSISSTRAFETIFKITYEIDGAPKVSIVIPNRNHAEDLKRCIDSIIERTSYDNYEIVIVENGSDDAGIESFYDELRTGPLKDIVKIVEYDIDSLRRAEDGDAPSFNYSSVVNYGIRNCSGEYVLLLNNDTQVISDTWIDELLMYAQRSDVGAVGAKLFFPNGAIQHAGVVLRMGAHRTAGHSHYGEDGNSLGYMGRLCYAQNVSAVTAACLMVSREKFESVNGFDERFAVSLNDVDFCLKLRERGYLNVFSPFAELYHYESLSRGLDSDGDKAERYERESELFREKWHDLLVKGDPYFNPNLSLDKSEFVPKALD